MIAASRLMSPLSKKAAAARPRASTPRPRASGPRRRASASRALEQLESRQLLSVTLVNPLPDSLGNPGTTAAAIDLSANFDDPTRSTVVRFSTQLGNIDVQLLDQQKPVTVANFLNYVRSGAYDNTFIHRSTRQETAGVEVIQGGGYAFPGFEHIPTNPPIVNEFTTNGIVSNTRGTIAMAKTSDPDSATSEWFINFGDNSQALDDPSNSGGFTVFGNVTAETLPTVDAIVAVPVIQAGQPFTDIPLIDYTMEDLSSGVVPTAANLILTPAEVLPELTFTATSSDPSIATPTISGNNLTLAYGTAVGSATITVTATDQNGETLTDTFTATTALSVVLGGPGAPRSVSFVDVDGTAASVSLRGAGTATVFFGGAGLAQTTGRRGAEVTGTDVSLTSISVTGSNASTALTVTTRGGDGRATLGDITFDAAARSVTAKTSNLTGDLTFGGAVGSIALADTTGATINIGGDTNARPLAITLGIATDTSILSGAPVKSVRATAFSNTDSTVDSLNAPAFLSITTSGGFNQSVGTGPIRKLNVGANLSGDVTASTIGSVTVRGDVNQSSLFLTQEFSARSRPLGNVRVGGAISDTTIRSNGNIGAITANALTNAIIFAGVNGQALPTDATGFAQQASIRNITVKTDTMNVLIAASTLGRVSLGNLFLTNNGQPFGVAADRISSLTATAGPGQNIRLRNLDTPQDLQTQAPDVVLGDARITLI